MTKSILTSIAVLAVIVSTACSERINYDGYRVYRFVPQTDEQVKLLVQMEENGFRFWNGPTPIGHPSDIMFAPHQQGLLQDLKDQGFVGSEYIPNVQRLIDNEEIKVDDGSTRLTWTQYNTLDQIYDWLREQAAEHSDIATLISIGKSFEGREVYVMKISTSNDDTKPIFFIEANIHAREWITSAVSTYIINELLNGNDTKLQSYLNDFDIYVVPVINPDGLAFTHTGDRLWRKTRSNTSNALCKGADGNRNFDFHWLGGGSSTNPCAETFAGAKGFSEPETAALAAYLQTETIKSRLTFYLGVHSYGHWILIPYGHTAVHIPEHDEYMRVGRIAADAIKQRYGKIFTPGNVVDLLYVASGEGFDWVKGVLNPYLSIEFELRDQGNYGFLLPANQIIPSSEEAIDGINAVLEQVKQVGKTQIQDPIIRRMTG